MRDHEHGRGRSSGAASARKRSRFESSRRPRPRLRSYRNGNGGEKTADGTQGRYRLLHARPPAKRTIARSELPAGRLVVVVDRSRRPAAPPRPTAASRLGLESPPRGGLARFGASPFIGRICRERRPRAPSLFFLFFWTRACSVGDSRSRPELQGKTSPTSSSNLRCGRRERLLEVCVYAVGIGGSPPAASAAPSPRSVRWRSSSSTCSTD